MCMTLPAAVPAWGAGAQELIDYINDVGGSGWKQGDDDTIKATLMPGNIVNVTGMALEPEQTLNLNIDPDVTVIWKAVLTDFIVLDSNPVILLSGSGTFRMIKGQVASELVAAIKVEDTCKLQFAGGNEIIEIMGHPGINGNFEVLSGTVEVFYYLVSDEIKHTGGEIFVLQGGHEKTIIDTKTLPDGQAGGAYSAALELDLDNGEPGAEWSIRNQNNSDTIPSFQGLQMSAGGLLSGTPSGSGDFSLIVRAENNDLGSFHQKAFPLTITGDCGGGGCNTGGIFGILPLILLPSLYIYRRRK